MKLGIAGSGMIVKDALTFLKEIREISLEAIYSRSNKNDSVSKLCENFSIKKRFDNYEEMLKDENIEVIYIALPNSLHYEFCKKALLNNKHVICEKPFTSNIEQLEELCKLAKENNLMLFEAISNQYIPNYLGIKKQISELGNIKIVECNFSQYSSRYDSFKNGDIIPPVFDINMSGGALMDINVYNIHFVVGLFGMPKSVYYYPNIEKNIDTSGILIMEYEGFKSVCIGSKDSNAKSSVNIQGDKGYIYMPSETNICKKFKKLINGQQLEKYNFNLDKHRMYYEFEQFCKIIDDKDYDTMNEKLEHSKKVMKVLTKARINN